MSQHTNRLTMLLYFWYLLLPREPSPLYEGNTIGRGAVRGGYTAQYYAQQLKGVMDTQKTRMMCVDSRNPKDFRVRGQLGQRPAYSGPRDFPCQGQGSLCNLKAKENGNVNIRKNTRAVVVVYFFTEHYYVIFKYKILRCII